MLPKTLLLAIGLCSISLLAWAQPELPVKAFEAGLSFAQGIAQWALLVAAGSIVTLVGTSYYRPRFWLFRMMYLLFLPGWIFLAKSLYYGVSVQRVYLAYLFTSVTEDKLKKLKETMTGDSFNELSNFETALIFFGIWLVLYLSWWLFNQEPRPEKG